MNLIPNPPKKYPSGWVFNLRDNFIPENPNCPTVFSVVNFPLVWINFDFSHQEAEEGTQLLHLLNWENLLRFFLGKLNASLCSFGPFAQNNKDIILIACTKSNQEWMCMWERCLMRITEQQTKPYHIGAAHVRLWIMANLWTWLHFPYYIMIFGGIQPLNILPARVYLWLGGTMWKEGKLN